MIDTNSVRGRYSVTIFVRRHRALQRTKDNGTLSVRDSNISVVRRLVEVDGKCM